MIVLPRWHKAGQRLRTQTTKGQHFSFIYQPAPAINFWAALRSYKSPVPQVLRPKILHLYENRDPNTLWWRVVPQHLSCKKVVRGACANRLRKAFREALHSKGYDANGRPLSQEMLPEGVKLRPRPLAGTLDIKLHESAITQYDPQILRDLMAVQLNQLMDPMLNRPLYKYKHPGNCT
jgi:hypothetical protein